MELELERRTALVELMERIAVAETSTIRVRFRIQRINAQIELLPFRRIGEHLFGSGHIDKLLFGHFLLIAVVRVRMPFLGGLPVRLDDLLLGRRPLDVQDFVVVALLRLFLEFARPFDALLGAGGVFVLFGSGLEVSNS